MKLLDAIKSSAEYLQEAGISEPSANAELLVLHASGIDRLSAYRDNPEIGENILLKIRDFLKRKSRGEPVQYIIGKVIFLGLDIRVGSGVLIPRPETELLAREAINAVQSSMPLPRTQAEAFKVQNKKDTSRFTIHTSLSILDLCCGSGCLSLAIAKEFPEATVYGTDISKTAVNYAVGNADLNGIRNVAFLNGSLFEPIDAGIGFDLIVANPPYIRSEDIAGLQREIRDWEPIEALDGGQDGLDFYRKIFEKAGRFLNPKGKIMLEAGYNQANEIRGIAENSGFGNITIIKDFSGIDRILKAEK